MPIPGRYLETVSVERVSYLATGAQSTTEIIPSSQMNVQPAGGPGANPTEQVLIDAQTYYAFPQIPVSGIRLADVIVRGNGQRLSITKIDRITNQQEFLCQLIGQEIP